MSEDTPYSKIIRCVIRFRTTEEGGRQTPMKVGILVDIEVGGRVGVAQFGCHSAVDEFVSPGEEIEVDITIAHPSTFDGLLYPGAKIELVTGHRTYGDGEVLEVESS